MMERIPVKVFTAQDNLQAEMMLNEYKGEHFMKTKMGKIMISILTLMCSILSACIGMGLLGSSGLSFGVRLLCGCCFMWTPIFVVAMISTFIKNREN